LDTPSNGQPTIGRPFDVQAKGGLRLTCAFYAECAHEGSKGSEGGGGGFAADYKKGGRGWRRRLCRRVVSPQGKRLTMICASLALLHPLLSLTHWIFRSLMLPYKSSSHSANHVRCASLRSGSKETRKLAAFPMDMQGFEISTHRKLSL